MSQRKPLYGIHRLAIASSNLHCHTLSKRFINRRARRSLAFESFYLRNSSASPGTAKTTAKRPLYVILPPHFDLVSRQRCSRSIFACKNKDSENEACGASQPTSLHSKLRVNAAQRHKKHWHTHTYLRLCQLQPMLLPRRRKTHMLDSKQHREYQGTPAQWSSRFKCRTLLNRQRW